MTNTTRDKDTRELDRRVNDGIDVTLLWNSVADQVVLAVHDTRTDESFELHVAAADALGAFHHPFVYANVGRAATRVPCNRTKKRAK